ncbi:MAG TPA: tetratricopeptide repeat protein [Dongiaceae bacterium]|nr:tetratricopeptide repeat protein [Dongiaceae bacterium]
MIPPEEESDDDSGAGPHPAGDAAFDDDAAGDEPFDEARAADDAGDDEGDDAGDDDAPETAEPGYLWTFGEQEERLGDEYERHMEILDDMEVGEILDLDLAREGDYVRWAAAQSLEEQGWTSQAIDVLRSIGRGGAPHPALSYPDIGLRLHDLLRERGDYAEALGVLEQVESADPNRRDACRERRAEVLILTGEVEEGLRLFEKAARSVPDEPWIPLTAAWALIRAGDYDVAVGWIARGERAARRLEDEEELRAVDNEVERLQNEARIRSERKRREAGRPVAPPAGEPGGVADSRGGEDLRQSILAALDAEEVLMTRTPPKSEADRAAAIERLAALHKRASTAWDEAVERHDEESIARFDDLQWEVVEVAERFGLKLPGVED